MKVETIEEIIKTNKKLHAQDISILMSLFLVANLSAQKYVIDLETYFPKDQIDVVSAYEYALITYMQNKLSEYEDSRFSIIRQQFDEVFLPRLYENSIYKSMKLKSSEF